AECCQNHNGSREILKRMIHAAAEAGAKYAKIQALRSSELTFRERFEEGQVLADGTTTVIKRPFQAEQERLKKLDLSDDDELWFVEECKRAGIKSMITVFTRFSTERMVAAGFDAVKIASYDCRSTSLLQEVAEKFRTVVVSTGASFDNEIFEAAKIFDKDQVLFLHCVTIYPTPLDQLHMNRMGWLRQFSPKVGFSDHTTPATTNLKASMLAIALEADVVERHFTVLEPNETRDGPVSVNPSQLRELCAFAKLPSESRLEKLAHVWPDWKIGLGEKTRDLSATELLNRDYYSGRVATWRNGQQISNQ
ncbi:MAG: general stress protein, partial [Actinobacteria bacterium]|nr:general stress protein [Actinomycetota bacterium]